MKIPEEAEIENLLSSIVFLVESVGKDTLSAQDIATVLHLRPPLSLGQIQDGRLMAGSPRDQIELFVGKDRIDIRDLSGAKPGKKPTANIATELLGYLDAKWRAVGFNYELLFPVPSEEAAGEFIAKKVVPLEALKAQIPISGAGITFFYKKEHKKYTLRIQPQGWEETTRDIYVNVNIHRNKSELGDEEIAKISKFSSLQDAFVKEYEEILDVLKML